MSKMIINTIKNKKISHQRMWLCCCFILMTTAFPACKKFVEIPASPDIISRPQVFSDSLNATSAVLGMYVHFSKGYRISSTNGKVTLFTGLLGDEIYPTGTAAADKEFYTNSIDVTLSDPNAFWIDYFNQIYLTNDCIEGISNSNGLSIKLKNQLIGESKVMRAISYFYLINIFGDVPLITTTDYNRNKSIARNSVKSVYDQIISDLTDASGLLTENYPSAGKVRINKYAALALLSRVYLYTSQWQKAEETASTIISSAKYSLDSNLNDVFLANSNETIWQLQPIDMGYETAEGFTFIPTNATILPKYVINTFLLNAFEPGDLRKEDWLKSNTVKGITYYYPFKYKLGRDLNTTPKENYMVFRLAEQYLIRAEARIKQGNIEGGISDLNLLRARSRAAVSTDIPNPLPALSTSLSPSDALIAVAHERQIELFCEWGHRWFDLRRTGQIDVVMPSVVVTKGGTWDTYKQLFPIPKLAIDANQSLIQNPGYH